MGRIFTSILWIVLSCQNTSLKSGVSSFHEGDTWFEMRVDNGMFGSSACVLFLNSVSMSTNGTCVEASIEEVGTDTTHIRFIVQAGVGELAYTVRLQNDVIKIPSVGTSGFVEGVLQKQSLDRTAFSSSLRDTEQRIELERQEWSEGAFSLQTVDGQIKGALVFDGEGVRVFVFDRHWLTPEIQYAVLETDGFDWIVEFDAEPQFLDSSTYIRIHFLEKLVSIPQSSKRLDSDIQYRLVPDPPSFEVLMQLQSEQIEESLIDERNALTTAVKQLGERLPTETACRDWMQSSALETPFWMGYTVQTKWLEDQCVFDIEPEMVQYRRTFIGTLQPNSN